MRVAGLEFRLPRALRRSVRPARRSWPSVRRREGELGAQWVSGAGTINVWAAGHPGSFWSDKPNTLDDFNGRIHQYWAFVSSSRVLC